MATVTYDPDRISKADVIAAIKGAGYEVVDDKSDSDDGDSGGVEIVTSIGSVDQRSCDQNVDRCGLPRPGTPLRIHPYRAESRCGQRPEPYPLILADGLFMVAIALSGYPVVRGGYYSARNRSLDIDPLIETAIIAATGIGYFVEAATLAVLFSIAELLEDYSMDWARDSLRELMELPPDSAFLRRPSCKATGSGS
jgi:Cd2+/Zn2+-exporting ATPase